MRVSALNRQDVLSVAPPPTLLVGSPSARWAAAEEARVASAEDVPISTPAPGCTKLCPGTVSERPKDHVSKTCVGVDSTVGSNPTGTASGLFAKLKQYVRETQFHKKGPPDWWALLSFHYGPGDLDSWATHPGEVDPTERSARA